MNEIIEILKNFSFENYYIVFKSSLDIIILFFILYNLINFSKDTRFFELVKAMSVLVLLYIIFYFLDLKTSIFLIESIGVLLFISIPIIFQYEIRRFLYNLGKERLFLRDNSNKNTLFNLVNILIETVKILSKKKIGALIILQRNNDLNNFIHTGIKLNCIVSTEIIETIFYSGTPLHDGALIINDNKIIAASVVLPLSETIKFERGKENLGTRHRAALGMAEKTDALCIIVSEETGDISFSMNSKLYRHLEYDKLEKLIIDSMQNNNEEIVKNIKDEGDKNIGINSNKILFKAFSIFLSISLYFIINNGISTHISKDLSEKTLILPIEEKYHGKNEVNKNKIFINPKYAKVKVNIDKNDIDNINPENISLWVNLDGVENKQSVKININSNKNISVKEIVPKNVIVSF